MEYSAGVLSGSEQYTCYVHHMLEAKAREWYVCIVHMWWWEPPLGRGFLREVGGGGQ